MSEETAPVHADLVVRGGRVIDPETGFDEVADVAVADGRVVAIGADADPSAPALDASGCIVAPGFVDLHSHAQSVIGHQLQARDGVTTALELEVGASPVADAYAEAAREGRPLNHGYAVSWGAIRMEVLAGHRRNGLQSVFDGLGLERWQRRATAAEEDRILGMVRQELGEGALGVGVLIGYAQGTDHREYVRLAALAKDAGLPTWTHARDLAGHRPDVLIDGADEIARTAAETGAHMHYCHVNSTSAPHIDHVLSTIDRARAEGSRVTVEAYPYGAGMTAISAQFLRPEMLALRGMTPRSLTHMATGERIADVARLEELRRTDPGGQVLVRFLDDDDPADRATLASALSHDGVMIASDAMPVVPGANGELVTHPRTAGTFSRSLRMLVDELGESWSDALARCGLLPARNLEAAVPAMARKGRIQVGSDADVVVFDPERLRDRATYTRTTVPTVGVRHLLVNGEVLIRDDVLDTDARPGRPVRA